MSQASLRAQVDEAERRLRRAECVRPAAGVARHERQDPRRCRPVSRRLSPLTQRPKRVPGSLGNPVCPGYDL
jgi:hypothetical protein